MKKRLLSLLLTATMITSMFNTVVLAADVEEQKIEETQIVCEICGHEHNEDCGYAEAVEGQPCTHQHSEDCGYEAGIDGTPCSHEHTEECYEMVTNCAHEHTDVCYPIADSGTEDTVPEDAETNAEDAANNSAELQIDDGFLITTPSEPTECTHECALDNGCIIEKLNCSHEHNTDECGYTASTEGVPCNHEHTAECGYVAAAVGSPCQHECITPMTAIVQTNDVYEVSSVEEYATALEQIAKTDAPSATIVLKTNLGDNARRTPATEVEKELVGGEKLESAKIIGVVGKHITLKSDGDAHYTVALGDCYLVGDVTFDNVKVSGSRIYANGFPLEFTENAEGGVTISVYGGSNRRPVENTHLILNGGTFGNGRQTVMIYGGGSSDGVGDSGGPSMSVDGNPSMPGYVPPAFNPGQGDVHGDVTIEIGKAKFENGMAAIIGGGINANVGGDVSITVNSVADFYHNFESITGAGESNQDGYGHVLGDVTIHANSGMVQYIYGTGWPGGAYGSNVEAGKRRSVGGNVTITAGTESGPTMRILGFSNTASIIGCGNAEEVGYTSTAGAAVGGDVHITLGKSAHFESFDSARKSAMEGVGINSVCYGTVTLINNGATYANELGIFSCYQGGKILNQEEEKNAATIIQNSGKLKHIEPVGTFGIAYPAEIKGDVSIEVNGGEITSVYGRQGENELEIDGNFNVLVTGGKLQYVFGTTVGREMTEGHISTLTFDGFSGNWLYYLGYLDDVNVTNSSTVRLTGATSYEPFYLRTVKNLTIESGSVLGLSKSGSLTGDLTVNGTLALTRTDNATDKTKPGTIATLSADGTATGTGNLKSVNADWFKTFLMDSVPVYLEEYVYADTDGSNLELTLTPAVTGLFANRKNHTENGRDVWFIDQGEPAEKYTVTYDANGGSGSMADSKSPYEEKETVTVLANTFTNGDKQFVDWNTQADGNGANYAEGATFAMPAANVVLYAQWKSNGGGETDPTPDPTYTVSYDANGGSGTAPAAPTKYKENATVTVLANTFTNGSKSFIGWKDGDGKSYSVGTTFSMPAKDIVLYAQWKSNNPGGGGGDTTDYTSLTVNKVWENDKAENRPTSIAVQLFRNEKAYGNPVKLTEENTWQHTWTRLDDSYSWTVDEVSVPQGYEKAVTGSGTKYTITNKWMENKPTEPEKPVEPGNPTTPTHPTEPSKPTDPNQPTKPDKLPQTNDTSATDFWLIMSILSGLGLILLNAKKQRKTDTE